MFRRFIGLAAVILLAGCQVEEAPTQPATTPLAVQITPALEWMKPAMADCAEQIPSLSMTVNTIAQDEQSLDEADVLFRWTNVPYEKGQTFVLGTDRLVFIVNPDNSLESIEAAELSGIYSGAISDWSNFAGITTGSIQPWVYPPNDDSQLLFATDVIALDEIIGTAHIASSPGFVIEAVAEDSRAIGMVPSRWLDSSVKTLVIAGYTKDTWELPILAVTREEPAEAMHSWLLCVQDAIQP